MEEIRLWEVSKEGTRPTDRSEPDRLIEVSQDACFGFAAFHVAGGITAKPGGGLAPVR